MIKNPKVGMKVRCISSFALGGTAFNRTCRIVAIHDNYFYPLIVVFDDLIYLDTSRWGMHPRELEIVDLSNEEQDQQRREIHAEKYL